MCYNRNSNSNRGPRLDSFRVVTSLTAAAVAAPLTPPSSVAPLVSSGLFWSLLVSSGLFWSLLVSSGLFWTLLSRSQLRRRRSEHTTQHTSSCNSCHQLIFQAKKFYKLIATISVCATEHYVSMEVALM